MRRYLEESRETNVRACVRACVALKVRTSDGGEREKRTRRMGLVVFKCGQTSADTSICRPSSEEAQQRVSAPGREGGRGTARASKGALTHRALSHVQGPVAVAGEVSLPGSFRYVSRRASRSGVRNCFLGTLCHALQLGKRWTKRRPVVHPLLYA